MSLEVVEIVTEGRMRERGGGEGRREDPGSDTKFFPLSLFARSAKIDEDDGDDDD